MAGIMSVHLCRSRLRKLTIGFKGVYEVVGKWERFVTPIFSNLSDEDLEVSKIWFLGKNLFHDMVI